MALNLKRNLIERKIRFAKVSKTGFSKKKAAKAITRKYVLFRYVHSVRFISMVGCSFGAARMFIS